MYFAANTHVWSLTILPWYTSNSQSLYSLLSLSLSHRCCPGHARGTARVACGALAGAPVAAERTGDRVLLDGAGLRALLPEVPHIGGAAGERGGEEGEEGVVLC